MTRWLKRHGWAWGLALLASAAGAAQRPPEGPAVPDRATVAQAYFELALMYHEQVFQSLDEAIAEYEKAVRAKPDYAEAQYHLALAYHTKAKLKTNDKALYRKAVAAYKLYLKYAPKGELATRARQNLRVIQARLR